MLTISKPLAPAQAEEYYEKDYADASRSLQKGVAPGEWSGRLAQEWELEGGVTRVQFARLCDGVHPLTGERIVGHARPRTCANFYGEQVTSMARRAGYDATFSAPKTVSLAALVGGDDRVTLAHREAVREAFGVLEENAHARMGGNLPAQSTGRLVAAVFEHEFARPDRDSGYAAPQLHTHCVVFNVTETSGGRTKPLQPLELHRAQRLATAVYRSALAWRLADLGYGVSRDPRTGAPEIEGFTREYVEASSPRRAEVIRRAEEIAARIERDAASGIRRGAGLLHAAAHADRAGKVFDPVHMKERHLELDACFGQQARTVVERALSRGYIIRDERATFRFAQESVTAARDDALSRGARVDARRLLADALTHGLCATTHVAVRAEFEARLSAGEFREVLRERRTERLEADAAKEAARAPTNRRDGYADAAAQQCRSDDGGVRTFPATPAAGGAHTSSEEKKLRRESDRSGALCGDGASDGKASGKGLDTAHVNSEATTGVTRGDVREKGAGKHKDGGMEIAF